MKIIFFCGSLEISKNGVGDYTRRLAAELLRQQQTVYLVSLSEKNMSEPFLEELEESEDVCISVLRISEKINAKEGFIKVKEWVDNLNPDCLSLQFVTFSFDKKGLPIRLARNLRKIGLERKWHIMFHELWVGMDIESTIKHKVWGSLQKSIIKNLVRLLKPFLITTNTHIYQYQLTKLGFKANYYLPLFSNIPVNINDKKEFYHNCEALNLVIFGNIHYGAPVNEFARQSAAYSKLNKVIKLIFIGECGIEKQTWINEWQSYNLPFKDYGKQPENEVSYILSHAEIGITTTPYWLTEKSGAVAAMHAHGLPVICVAREWNMRTETTLVQPANIFLYNKYNFNDLMRIKKDSQIPIDIKDTTRIFLRLLSGVDLQ